MYKWRVNVSKGDEILMNRVIEILIQRDGITAAEAQSILDDVRVMFKECDYDPDECENIMQSQLGLEPDYIIDVLLD